MYVEVPEHHAHRSHILGTLILSFSWMISFSYSLNYTVLEEWAGAWEGDYIFLSQKGCEDYGINDCVNVVADYHDWYAAGIIIMLCLFLSALGHVIKPCKLCAKIGNFVVMIATLPWLLAMIVVRFRNSGRVYAELGFYDSQYMTWSIILLVPIVIFGVLSKMWCHKKHPDEPQM